MSKSNNKNASLNEALDIISSNNDLSDMLKEGGLLRQLTKCLLERALQAELNEHLGYDKYQRSKNNNTRNGATKKNLITDDGILEIEVPRDRESEFEPAIIPKRSTRVAGLNDKIISLYAKGMSISDIQKQLKEMYGAEVSSGLISKVTDEVMDEVTAWQSRPLDAVYPIVFFDCLVAKVREDKRIINKAIYVALGVELSGRKDILGLWISENEGAKFWLGNLTELKNRGVKDILIACTDNLTGMSDAIAAVFPKTEHQLCIVHQIRIVLVY